jgi:hypothetical protein
VPPTTIPFRDLHDQLVATVGMTHLSRTNSVSRERRSRPRLYRTLPATAWGVDVFGDPFRLECFVHNISASGLLMRVPRRIKHDVQISLVVRFVSGTSEGATAALKGVVVRSACEAGDVSDVAITIREHRFI